MVDLFGHPAVQSPLCHGLGVQGLQTPRDSVKQQLVAFSRDTSTKGCWGEKKGLLGDIDSVFKSTMFQWKYDYDRVWQIEGSARRPELFQKLSPLSAAHRDLPDHLVENNVVDALLCTHQLQQTFHLWDTWPSWVRTEDMWSFCNKVQQWLLMTSGSCHSYRPFSKNLITLVFCLDRGKGKRSVRWIVIHMSPKNVMLAPHLWHLC